MPNCIYHIVYRTTCLVTNKFYVGRHSTNKIDDGYLGSGKILVRSVKKYGRENHVRETLAVYEDFASCVQAEIDTISEEVRADPLCMNISAGGAGPSDYKWTDEQRTQASRSHLGKVKSAATRAKMSAYQKTRPRRQMSEEERQHLSRLNKGQTGKWEHSEETKTKISQMQIGRKHSEETKQKMREAHARRLQSTLLNEV